ncbi:hypothetical protein TCAL_16174, partial [Tigriopus californicus]
PSYDDQPANISTNYEVKDDYAGLKFDANESVMCSFYLMVAPQKVTYTVDGQNGYVADVQYYGEAVKYEKQERNMHPRPLTINRNPPMVHVNLRLIQSNPSYASVTIEIWPAQI